METTQDINSILSKLKKLQRLYEGAKAINSEAEAANAAAGGKQVAGTLLFKPR